MSWQNWELGTERLTCDWTLLSFLLANSYSFSGTCGCDDQNSCIWSDHLERTHNVCTYTNRSMLMKIKLPCFLRSLLSKSYRIRQFSISHLPLCSPLSLPFPLSLPPSLPSSSPLSLTPSLSTPCTLPSTLACFRNFRKPSSSGNRKRRA